MTRRQGEKSVENLIDKYLEHLKLEKNYSPRTLESYAHYLTRFLQWTGVTALKDLSPTLIRDYQIKLYDFTDERGSANPENAKLPLNRATGIFAVPYR